MDRPYLSSRHWRTLQHKLESCWQTANADPALRQRLLNRQLETWQNGRWINHLSIVSAALLIAVSAHPLLGGAGAALWVGALLFNPVSGIGFRHLYRRFPFRDRLSVQQTLLLKALATGFLYQSVASWLYLSGSHSLSKLIGLITCGVLCSGALGFSRMPQIGLVWLSALGAANIATLLYSPHEHDAVIALAMFGYVLVLAKDMLLSARSFVRRCEAEFEAERQSHLVSLMLQEFEGASQDWFWETDARGRLTHASPRLSEVLGTHTASLLGRGLTHVLGGERTQDAASQEALQRLADRLAGQKPFRDLVVPLQIGANRLWWSLGARPLLDTAGAVQGWRGVGTDTTSTHRHEQELQRLVRTDSLTNLSSRHGFQQHLRACLSAEAEADLSQRPIALLMIDLDGFKGINDAHGHGVGDALLQAVAERLASMVTPGALLARLGGDEFALVMACAPDQDRTGAQALGQAMLIALRQPFLIGLLRMEVRASIGLAYAPEHGHDSFALLRAADMALYAAKAEGRDRLRAFDETLGEQALHRALLGRELAQAVAEQQFDLLYQPIFDAHTGQPTGAEALLRWCHPRLGTVAPGLFITLAEESGCIHAIGAWVLRQACTEAAQWPPSQRLAVNLSVRQLREPQFVAQVAQILAESGLAPARLELEVTESALADEQLARTQLSALKALGVRLALDDFGTGYSSLSYLQRFQFDRLKIDRSFVVPLQQADNVQQTALVRAVIDMAAALRLRCTAEGIEHDAQADLLRSLGCDELQGFQLGRPMAAAALRQCISASTPETARS